MAWNRVVLKEAAVRMGMGKLVAPGTTLEKWVPGPILETPWRASDHHSYFGIPSLLTSAAEFTRFPIFSSNVSLFTRSSTLFSTDNDLSQNPKPAKAGFLATSQAKTADVWPQTRLQQLNKTVAQNNEKQRKTEETFGSLFSVQAMINYDLENTKHENKKGWKKTQEAKGYVYYLWINRAMCHFWVWRKGKQNRIKNTLFFSDPWCEIEENMEAKPLFWMRLLFLAESQKNNRKNEWIIWSLTHRAPRGMFGSSTRCVLYIYWFGYYVVRERLKKIIFYFLILVKCVQ